MDNFKIVGEVGGYTDESNPEFTPDKEGAPPPWDLSHASASSTVDGWKKRESKVYHTDQPPKHNGVVI